MADISGFALPPLVASQLQRLVAAAGPAAAAVSADALLAVYDLPALLEVGVGVRVGVAGVWVAWVRLGSVGRLSVGFPAAPYAWEHVCVCGLHGHQTRVRL